VVENTIFYSSAGVTECLVALPETTLLGGTVWQFIENPAFTHTPVVQLKNPNPIPGFELIGIYNVALKTEAGVQRFQEIQGGVHLPLPLVKGAISMITHPLATTQFIHANLPVGGIEKQPLLVAVKENAGSTGYRWEQFPTKEAGLITVNNFFPPDTKLVGAPGIRVFEFKAEEPGAYTVQLKLMPPAGKLPVATIVVTLHAINQ